MLHAKFLDHRTSGSEKDFLKGLTIYGHVTWTIYTNFRFPFPRRLYMKFGFDRSRDFRGEGFLKLWTSTTTTTTDTGAWIYMSSAQMSY